MRITTTLRTATTRAVGALMFALLAVAPAADAQDREGRWEFTLGTLYQLSSTVDGQEGSTVDTDNDFGFEIGSAYNFSDNLAANIGLQWSGIGYNATGMEEDGTEFGISGTYDAFTLSTNLVALYKALGGGWEEAPPG